jgi:hypothetical protein
MEHKRDISCIIENYPDLGYDGWRIEPDDRQFAERRRELEEASAALELCRRAFRDERFRKLHKGRQSDYRLKHLVETWDFEPAPGARRPTPHYNGIYVCSGVAVAAALLEGFCVHRQIGGRRSYVDVPGPLRTRVRCKRCSGPNGVTYN